MNTVFKTTTKAITIACFAMSVPCIATRSVAETTFFPEMPPQTIEQQPSLPNFQAQVSPSQLNSIFTPPPRPAQQTSTYTNYRVTPVKERGDRPQLRDIMSRLQPAPLPNFVHTN